ncbi:hypothetical protein Hanom_Chr11g00989881 [Helianthus anomalus]
MVKLRNEKRYADLEETFCSPFYNRVVNMHKALLDRELSVMRYTFSSFTGIE